MSEEKPPLQLSFVAHLAMANEISCQVCGKDVCEHLGTANHNGDAFAPGAFSKAMGDLVRRPVNIRHVTAAIMASFPPGTFAQELEVRSVTQDPDDPTAIITTIGPKKPTGEEEQV